MAAPNSSPAEAVLIETLRRSSRRLARREALADVLWALPVALLVPILVTLWRLIAPVPRSAVLAVSFAALAAYVGYAVWRLTRQATLARGAAELDREAALQDALKTAEWFVRRPPDSPWVARQVERAAEQAAALDVERLIPIGAPRGLWARAAVVVLALGLLNVAPPLALRAVMTATSQEHPTLTVEELETIKDIKALLEKADLAPETRRRLAELLDMLEANELRTDETIDVLNEAQELLSESNERTDGTDTPMGEPQKPGQQKPDGTKKADGEQAKGEPSEGEPEGDQAKDSDDAKNAGEQAREAASNELRKLQDKVEARQKNQEQRAANDQTKSDAQDPENASEGGKQESESEQQGQSQKSASNADNPAPSDKGGKGSDPSSEGDAQGEPGDPTKLDVTLKRAALKTEIEPEILTPKELIEKDTKAGESKLQYQDLTTRTPYDQAEPMGTHEIPWMYRELVKTYFEAVGSRGTHDHD